MIFGLEGEAAAGGLSGYTMWIWIAVMLAVFYFLIIRPQKKKEKEERQLRNSIQPGDEIVTIGGFVGKVVSVKEDTITFEMGADRSKMTVKKWAIQTRTSPEQKAAEAEKAAEEAEKAAAKAEQKDEPKKKKGKKNEDVDS